jgi:hypothetical protein
MLDREDQHQRAPSYPCEQFGLQKSWLNVVARLRVETRALTGINKDHFVEIHREQHVQEKDLVSARQGSATE